ncbi:MAG: hypothetical protein IKT70_03055 [Clostridia bacterium]|nr:hypothetical protein [Clostridia bacterium]
MAKKEVKCGAKSTTDKKAKKTRTEFIALYLLMELYGKISIRKEISNSEIKYIPRKERTRVIKLYVTRKEADLSSRTAFLDFRSISFVSEQCLIS